MEVVFLGTGSGAVSSDRFHTALLLRDNTAAHLIDCGDAVSRAILSAGVDYNSILSIIITHFHADHLNGLSTLVTQMKMNKRTIPLNIFVHEKLASRLKNFLEMNYIIDERLDFQITISSFMTGEPFSPGDSLNIIARENSHLDKYKQYVEDHSALVSLGLYIAWNGKHIFYTGDVSNAADLHLFDDRDTDIVIAEFTHVSPEQIETFYEQMKAVSLYLTHINSAEYGTIQHWYAGLTDEQRARIKLTVDRDVIRI